MGFLSSALRDDGSFSYKKAIVDSVIDIATNADVRGCGKRRVGKCRSWSDLLHSLNSLFIL